MYEDMGTEPPCIDCIPALLDENEDAIKIFNVCQSQVLLTSMGDIIGMNLGTVIEVMKIYNVADKKSCLNKVITLSHEFLLKKDED